MSAAVDRSKVERLAAMIEAAMAPREEGPALRVVRDEPRERSWLQPFERDMRYSLIRDLARLYDLWWLVRRETEHVDGVMEQLTDADLIGLHATMRRAQDCILEDVGFDVAGLL